MSYLRKIEYRIVPDKSFKVIHNCAGCGCKRDYINTKHFRVNANGNKLDVWLIYQCEKCKHTLNLTIYERQNPDRIPKEEYLLFLANDEELADEYGRNLSFFAKNRAEVDAQSMTYDVVRISENTEGIDAVSHTSESATTDGGCDVRAGDLLVVHNSYGIKVRKERLAAQLLNMSRNQLQKQMESGDITVIQQHGCIEILVISV